MSEVAIRAQALRRSYGRTLVLRGVDFELAPGRTLCLAGSNGVGKSTLLYLLATLLRPHHGTLSVLGESLPEAREAVRRRLGFVAHNSFLYPQLTLRENLGFYGELYGLSGTASRVDELAQTLDMASWLDKAVGTLSRGLQQRGAWMRALLHDPDLLLLDEPFTGLDASSLRRLVDVVQGCRQAGKTIVLTSHDLGRDLPLCDEVMTLVDGRVESHQPVTA
jgi:heme exporter protein A